MMRKFSLGLLVLTLSLMSLTAASAAGSKALKGDTVKVDYIGRLDNGKYFDTSFNKDPLEFEIGAARMLEAFENAIIGMKAGDIKTFTIPAREAYGEASYTNILKAPRDKLPDDIKLEVGSKMRMRTPQSVKPSIVRIIELDGEDVYVDTHHQLAAKNLTFDVKVLSVKKPAKKS